MTEPGPELKLAKNAIGLTDVLFQSITSMAPAAAIAASIPLGAAFAGGALPLSVLIAFVGILFTAWAIGQLATHIPAAGSLATQLTVTVVDSGTSTSGTFTWYVYNNGGTLLVSPTGNFPTE